MKIARRACENVTYVFKERGYFEILSLTNLKILKFDDTLISLLFEKIDDEVEIIREYLVKARSLVDP